MNGNFTPWTSWTACTTTCGFGTRARYRNCTDPPPLFGGSDCLGPLYEMKECENATTGCPGKHNLCLSWLPTVVKKQGLLINASLKSRPVRMSKFYIMIDSSATENDIIIIWTNS